MRTLHFGLRVADLHQSLAFSTAIGYEVVGEVPETPLGHLCMLKLARDEFVTLELFHDPVGGAVEIGSGFSHFVIQVEALDSAVSELAAKGIAISAG
jgi:lactoylglutathione lyase